MPVFQGSPSGIVGIGGQSRAVYTSSPPEALQDLVFLETTVPMTLNVGRKLVDASGDRVYLGFFWNAGTNLVSLATLIANLSTTLGATVAQQAPFVLNWPSNASSVNQAWYGLSSVTGSMMVHQIFYRPLRLPDGPASPTNPADCG